ncbi:MAG TPA: alpha-L-fucosidase [Fimbriimonas sp.]|nr:alpha-L-fucosidase [Fimbriimonas sp.]
MPFIAAAAALIGLSLATQPIHQQSKDPNAGETKAHRDARMRWWRQARFGMFIHWGLYAVPAGEYKGRRTPSIGEWIMHDLKIPVADYAELAKQFNPVQFNADEWVGIAKAAGMKYIVMTAKHHEGFAMFHTATDRYNIYDATPFKRDPIAEMAAACKKAGIKFGVYYSQAQDWHHAGGAAYGGHWDPAQDGDLHQYVKTIAAPQVRELLTKYHPAVLWWDTSVDMSDEDIRELTAAFPEDPGLIANNRLGNGVPGDTETPEQTIPANGFGDRDWETCMTINDTWGYKYFDTNFKSVETLLHNLIDIASKGGNYLLNVGPEPTGVIPGPEVERLKAMGEWLKMNGKSIYGAKASPYKRTPFDGRLTVKDNTLYMNVFNWPESHLGIALSGLQTRVKSAHVLATGEQLNLIKDSSGTVYVPMPRTVDPISTAIELDLEGRPAVVEPEYTVAPSPGGAFELNAVDSELSGSQIQIEGSGRNANVGWWFDRDATASWKLNSPSEGRYVVSVTYACDAATPGSTFGIQVDGKDTGLKGNVKATEGWQRYATADLDGTITLSPGRHTLKVFVINKPGEAVMNLRHIELKPATP